MCLSVNDCCCCFTLNVGTKIISVLSTLSALILLLLYGSSALISSEDLPPIRLVFYASMAVTAAVQSVFGFFLIYGAFTNKPKYTVPWTVLAWSQSVMLLGLAVTGSVLLSFNRRLEISAEISMVISAYFIYALILLYFALVVNSRRQQMAAEGRVDVAKRLMRHHVLPNYYV